MIRHLDKPLILRPLVCRSWLATMSLAAVVTASAPSNVAAADSRDYQLLCDFDTGNGNWSRREYDASGQPVLTPLGTDTVSEMPGSRRSGLAIPLVLPGRNEFVTPAVRQWTGWQTLHAELFLPEGVPQSTVLYVFTKDWDHLWRQVRMELPPERGRSIHISVPISGPEAQQAWTTAGHQRPWHNLTPGQLKEFGIALEPETGAKDAFTGVAYLLSMALSDPVRDVAVPRVANLGISPDHPRVLERIELALELQADYHDPFDPSDVAVKADFRRPDGRTETARGFYFEDFLFRDATGRGATDKLYPHGRPQFRIRYTPRVSGVHHVTVTASCRGKHVALPEFTLAVESSLPDKRGFIRVDPDDRKHFAYESGEEFWGLGINVRSPFDNRYVTNVPYSLWEDEGYFVYERLFEKYAQIGINVVEVWMSSWWLALEWIADAPGNHGVGYMNQHRAWLLDRTVELAEKYGIYLILVFNNHGKFGALNDTEWARNPFNVANGGFLTSCEEYFSDRRALRAFDRLADYTVARWSYSPNILMWKLFTEIDLTGTTYEFYYSDPPAEWHRHAGRYLKQNDIYRHMITTHWMLSYRKINESIAALDELDVLTTDAYYFDGQGTDEMLSLIRGGANCGVQYRKPLLVTEFGGSPHADSMGNLIKQHHLGIWTGFFCHSPVAPLFWWFALVEEKNLYGTMAALSRFTDGETRRGLRAGREYLTDGEARVLLNTLNAPDRYLAWGFDMRYYFDDDENRSAQTVSGIEVNCRGLKPGRYRADFWDCVAGTVSASSDVSVGQAGTVTLSVPAFTRDFAVKVKPLP